MVPSYRWPPTADREVMIIDTQSYAEKDRDARQAIEKFAFGSST